MSKDVEKNEIIQEAEVVEAIKADEVKKVNTGAVKLHLPTLILAMTSSLLIAGMIFMLVGAIIHNIFDYSPRSNMTIYDQTNSPTFVHRIFYRN